MSRPGEWLRYRLGRIPRKLRFARHRTGWLYRDAVNGFRIAWDLRLLGWPLQAISRYERRIDSQNGEDGILEAIFTKIGTTNKYFVEFGAGNAGECNTTYLARWKGWTGLWMDARHGDPRGRVKREHVTAENIQALFAKYGVPKRFDLLSIDIDGNDYWVWQAIVDYLPRVVVIEYNANIPPTQSLTIPYEPAFVWDAATDYFGASLLALQRLGHRKGYVLVGCDSSGTNAFFIHQSAAKGHVVPQPAEHAYRPPACWNGQGHPRETRRIMIPVEP